jgi:flagellar motor switch protein FliG
MNGIKKAALFLSSLDYMEVDQLLSRLDGESARQVRREIMSLRHHDVSAETSHKIDEEFLHAAGWTPSRPIREHQFATPKSATYMPPKVGGQRPAVKYNAESFIPPVRAFDFMQNWSVNDIVSAIVGEYPQIIAVVLAHLPQSKMKAALSAFPLDLRKEVKRRLDGYEMPDEQIVQEIESALKMRYRQQNRRGRRSVMLESFDDMETLSDSELSTLFRSVDLTTAMLALIGAEPALIARITKHFSPTEEHHMRKRLQKLGSIDEEDIEQARQDILEQYNGTLQ